MANPATTSKQVYPKRAMILAAGLGVRMRPLTDAIPKAMIEVAGKPLIGYALDFLGALDVERIVVNVHYRPGPLLDYLKSHPLSKRIIISDERDKILDTGGGVKKALPYFAGEPFFVGNCDSFFNPRGENPYLTLGKAYWGKGGVLLLEETGKAVGYEGPGDFFLQKNATLKRRGKNTKAPYVFTGLQILTPSLFAGIKGEVFSLNKVYDRAIAEKVLFGEPARTLWFHIGTPAALMAAEDALKSQGGK